jgi:hypothetical protein
MATWVIDVDHKPNKTPKSRHDVSVTTLIGALTAISADGTLKRLPPT